MGDQNCEVFLRSDIKISKPRYDQNTYWNRFKHFYGICWPLNSFITNSHLDHAERILTSYKNEEKLCITEEELWEAKRIYDSAYNPTTGERIMVFGRMCTQTYANMFILGGMMTFYKSNASALFWQWLNQTYNACINFYNRSGDHPIDNNTLAISYLGATTGAVGSAIFLNKVASHISHLAERCVPFAAAMVANAINIPLMRSHELQVGIPVFTHDGEKVGNSVVAAKEAVLKVLISRWALAFPPLTIGPIVADYLEKRGTLCRYPWINLPVQVCIVGFAIVHSVPMAMAIYKQECEIPLSSLESHIQQQFKQNPPKTLIYNKGL